MDVWSNLRPVVNEYKPVEARTQTAYTPLDAVAYDCLKIIVLRSGSATLVDTCGTHRVEAGDIAVLAWNAACGAEMNARFEAVNTRIDHLDRDIAVLTRRVWGESTNE